ncbi:chain length determinant protein EpsF [Burkholderiales bacterium JOSHI_001]|nr:chain length determinant protein EpsF [Burkholderiales bacterium JOSHI_001]
MTISQFFAILRARWLTALVVLLLVVGGTAAASYYWPKKYSATASVVIDAKPDPVTAMIYPGMAAPGFLATQVDVIQSERVALRVVRNLKLADNPQVVAQWREEAQGQGTVEGWLAGSFSQNMDVKPSRESNVISISYKAADPRFAAVLANAFVQAYIDTTLDMRVDPAKQYSAFFDGRAKEAREALEKAQSRLSAFQRDKGIIASDERLDVENARLNELSSQLVALQAVSAESGSRQAQAVNSADRMQEVLNNPLISGLKADLSRQEARLQEMNARLGEAHPQVIELKANIAEMRSRLAEETKRVTGSVTVNNTINRSRETQLRASLDAQRAKLLQMKAVRDEGAVLMRDIESAQRAYDTVVARLNQTSLESQANQSNVNFLTQATPPLQPSSPKLLLNVLLSVGVGTFLALLAAFARELLDRRVRSLEDAATAVGLPVIGIMPRPSARRLAGGKRMPLMQQRVLGQLPGPKPRRA